MALLISKTLYCHEYCADFTYFVHLGRELFLHSLLTFHENGPVASLENERNVFKFLLISFFKKQKQWNRTINIVARVQKLI